MQRSVSKVYFSFFSVQKERLENKAFDTIPNVKATTFTRNSKMEHFGPRLNFVVVVNTLSYEYKQRTLHAFRSNSY